VWKVGFRVLVAVSSFNFHHIYHRNVLISLPLLSILVNVIQLSLSIYIYIYTYISPRARCRNTYIYVYLIK
jgi:hypothetical protein